MRRKAAIQIVLISLLLASAAVCFANKAKKPSDAADDKPLSYDGHVAMSLAQELIDQQTYDEARKQANKPNRTG